MCVGRDGTIAHFTHNSAIQRIMGLWPGALEAPGLAVASVRDACGHMIHATMLTCNVVMGAPS